MVTSDHGTNLTPPDIGRMRVTDANREEVFRVPLFIKAPGQTDGRGPRRQRPDDRRRCRRSSTCSTPTSTGSSTGTRCSTAAPPTVEPRVSTDVAAVARHRRDGAAEEFPHGDDWIGLAAVGDNGDLVGRDVAEFERRRGRASTRRRSTSAASSPTCPTDDGRDAVRHLRHGRPGRGRAAGAARRGQRPLAGVIGGYCPTATAGRSSATSPTSTARAATTWRSTRSAATATTVTLHPVAAADRVSVGSAAVERARAARQRLALARSTNRCSSARSQFADVVGVEQAAALAGEQAGRHRVVAVRELDDERGAEVGEEGDDLVERHVVRQRQVVDDGEAEHEVGPHPLDERRALAASASRSPVTGRRGRRRAAGCAARPRRGAGGRGGRRRGGRSRRRSTDRAPASTAMRENRPSLAPRSSTTPRLAEARPTAAATNARLGLEVAVGVVAALAVVRPRRVAAASTSAARRPSRGCAAGRRSAPGRSRPASARRGRRARGRHRRTCARRGRAAGRG